MYDGTILDYGLMADILFVTDVAGHGCAGSPAVMQAAEPRQHRIAPCFEYVSSF